MSLARILPTVILALIALPTSAIAQRLDSLAVALGTRVRVIVYERPPGKLVGPLVGKDSTRVYVDDDYSGRVMVAEWSSIRSIQVKRRNLLPSEAFARGARVGAIVFGTLGVGLVTYAIVWDAKGGCDNSEYCIPATLLAVPLAYLGTIGGTVLSGTVGLLFDGSWRTVWRPIR